MDPMPLAGLFCESEEEAKNAPKFPLTWVTCQQCGLVQVLEEIGEDVLFGRYNYASSTVQGLVQHFDEFARFLRSRYSAMAQVKFLEIGCNDGVLLNKLPETWSLMGIDPSDVAVGANGPRMHYHLINERFSSDLVDHELLGETFDVVSGSNCFAHISDLLDVFVGVHKALTSGGHFWLEVHDLEALLLSKQWDTIYHEHKVEWSIESLCNCLLPIGFSIVDIWKAELHGGLLRACFRKEHKPQTSNKVRLEQKEFQSLQSAYDNRYHTSAAQELAAAQSSGKQIAAFGAAGRANVFLNQVPSLNFNYVVDESPLRVDKFLPTVGIPVVGPEKFAADPPDLCLITAWNYASDIVSKNSFQGKWLTAFRAPSQSSEYR